jgi:peptidoglycan biosynthesis protein MviN/MurJ (putative lipid II flippase)
MQYLKPLLTLNYWFNTNPPPFVAPVFLGLGIVLAVIFVAGIVIKWFGYKKRGNPPLHRVLSRVGRALISSALLGGFLYFVSYEQTPVVSMRFWWLVLLVAAIIWKIFILLDILKRYPVEKKARLERLEREKYLPK